MAFLPNLTLNSAKKHTEVNSNKADGFCGVQGWNDDNSSLLEMFWKSGKTEL